MSDPLRMLPRMTAETEPDPVMTRIGEAIALGQQGRRAEARVAFDGIWSDLGDGGEPLHRLTVAHHMADVQDDPHDELTWDLRALEAAESVTDDAAAEAGATGPVAAFYPSLHLNLGEDYRKLGDRREARSHLELGREAASLLGRRPLRRHDQGRARRAGRAPQRSGAPGQLTSTFVSGSPRKAASRSACTSIALRSAGTQGRPTRRSPPSPFVRARCRRALLPRVPRPVGRGCATGPWRALGRGRAGPCPAPAGTGRTARGAGCCREPARRGGRRPRPAASAVRRRATPRRRRRASGP